MNSVYQLKSRFQALLRPLVQHLAARGISANQVTVSAVLLSMTGGAAIAFFPNAAWPYLLLPLILFIRMALNAIDGMLAREHHMQTKLGAILNELGDVVSDTLLYLPFALMPGISASIVILVVIFSIVSEMTGVISVQIGASRRYDGPLGKSDRAVLFGGLGLFFGVGMIGGGWINIILAIALLLLALTIINRAKNALKEASA